MTARWLMDNGYLTPVEIEAYEIKETCKEEFPDYASERSFLAKNQDRMEVIADLIINRCEKYGNTLVLVSSIQFGEKLAAMIDGAVFLYGATDTDTRKEHYDLFETEENLIRIATYGIASTGISIDRIMCLVMIDSGKSYIRAIQTIGRSLRQADGKLIAYVCDVHSNLKWSRKHYKERKKHYNEAEYPIIGEYKLKV
jgi:superfamily II DNA or RNA helicase